MRQLKSFISSKVNISSDLLDELVRHFTERKLKKGRYLLRQGQLMNHYYFIEKGGLRVFINQGDKDLTAWLSFENNFIVDIASVNLQQPSSYNIQAIEDCQLLAISCRDMEKLYKQHNEWQEFGRKLWENAFLEVVTEMVKHQTLSAEERYAQLLEKSEVLQRVPLKQLSSFLGITPTSLSRIRNKLSQ